MEGNTHRPEGGLEPVWAWLKSGGAHPMLAQASEAVDVADPDGYVLRITHT